MPPFSLPIFVTCPVSIAFQEQETTKGHTPLFIPKSDPLSRLALVCRWVCLSSQEEVRENLK